MESLQLLIYFGGLVTASVASIAYLLTRKMWVAPVIIMPMFIMISLYSAFQLYVLLIGAGFSIISFLISLGVKVLLNKDKMLS